MKILVTGANGFIGRAVLKQLISNGFVVRAFVRDRNKISNKDIEIAVGDITNKDSLVQAMRGVDGIVHLVAVKLDEKESFQTNVLGTKNLVEVAKAEKVKFIVNTSSSSTKIKEKGDYAKTKAEADKIIISSGIPYTILKPSIVYADTKTAVFGALARFANLPVTPVIGDGKCNFYPIHPDDLAKIISLSIKDEKTRGKVYDIGGPDKLSIDEIIRSIAKNIFKKRKVFLIHIPKSFGLFLAKFFKVFMSSPPITISNVLGSTQDIEWSKERAFEDFGFIPRSFRDGLKDVEENFHKNEVNILFKYVYSSSGYQLRPSADLRKRYYLALKNNDIKDNLPVIFLRFPFLIGPIDVISKLFYSDSLFQRRLLIATAIVECDTESAKWLLPKDRDLPELFLGLFLITVKSFIKFLLGILLMIIGFTEKYAK